MGFGFSIFALQYLWLAVYGQRGIFFAEDKPAQQLRFIPVRQSTGDARENVLIRLTRPIKFYQDTNVQHIRVFRDGLVTIGPNTVRPGCPKDMNRSVGPGTKALMPYWMQSTSGIVTFQEFTNFNEMSFRDVRLILKDVNNAFRDNVDASSVQSVVIVTWNDAKNARNLHRKELKNSFQLAILTTAQASYAIYVYRVMDVFWVNARNGQDARCQENAISGIRAIDRSDDFSLSQFFLKEYRDWIAYFSNIDDFQNLGRYAMKLSVGATQPLPPTAECTKENPDPTICIRSNWFPTEPIISTTFCQFRDAGIFQYPLSCTEFVECGVSKYSFSLKRCPDNTNFNPQLGICDKKENFECRFPGGVVLRTNETIVSNKSIQQKFLRQPVVHENFCFLRANGLYPHPTLCGFYLVCSNSRGITRRCPANLFWDVTHYGHGYCNYRYTVKCKNGKRNIVKTTLKPIGSSTRKPTIRIKVPTITTRKPNRVSTTTTNRPTFSTPSVRPFTRKFTRITTPTFKSTQYTQHQTSRKAIQTTKQNIHTTSKTPMKANDSTSFCASKVTGQYPDPKECGTYLVCVNGRRDPIKMECPASLYFQPITANSGYCNFSRNVCCVNGNRDSC